MAWSTSSGISLRYECRGQGANLILIHEMGGSLHSWDAIVDLLAPSFRVLSYDQRGAGTSEKVRQPFSMADHVNDLEAAIAAAALDGPYFIVGCAAGAAAALRMAEKHPEQVLGLVLCCPAISVSEARQKYIADRAELCARDGMRAVVTDTLSRSYPDVVVKDRAAYENYRGHFLANDPVSYGLINRAFAESNSETLGGEVQCPCLVLAGMHDLLRPEAEVRGVAERLSHAEFALIEAAHLPHVQAPERLAAFIVSFVHKCQTQAANAMPSSRS